MREAKRSLVAIAMREAKRSPVVDSLPDLMGMCVVRIKLMLLCKGLGTELQDWAGNRPSPRLPNEVGLSGERHGCPNGPGLGCGAILVRSMTAGSALNGRQTGEYPAIY